MKILCTILFVLCFAGSAAVAEASGNRVADQDSVRMAGIRQRLDHVAQTDTAYNGRIDMSVVQMALPDLLRNVARINQVNLSVKGADKIMVTSNFSNVRVTDLIYFLCREYDLDMDVVGNIVSVFPRKAPVPETRVPDIKYDAAAGELSYDLSGDKLIDVAKKITSLTGVNIVIPQVMYAKQVSGYVSRMPFDEAVGTLAAVNGLEAVKDMKKNVWAIAEGENDASGKPQKSSPAYKPRRLFASNQLAVDSLGYITAAIGRGNVEDLIRDVCDRLHLNCFFITKISQQVSIYVKDVDFDTFVGLLLSGTPHSYYNEQGVYIFGTTTKEHAVVAVNVISMRYRSVDKVADLIPTSIKADLQITPFVDLNSLIVCGEQRKLSRVETFLRTIDQRVPMVTMEIMIVDATRSNVMEAGIGMGIGDKPVKTAGTLSPGIDVALGASSVNKLINSFNGFGSVNLGKVTPEFYMSLKFLEENGTIELRSTPKLSTLNGHEANLKSGETKYYKEVQSSYIGTQNPIQSEGFTWKSTEASLSIKITPFVSEDNQITLDVEIEQSEFTAREEKEAPPGTATRSFKSLVKVQNEEMVLLGGIDRNSREKSASGLPFIARIPVLKWIFGSTKNNKQEHKLNVFIKPTVID